MTDRNLWVEELYDNLILRNAVQVAAAAVESIRSSRGRAVWNAITAATLN